MNTPRNQLAAHHHAAAQHRQNKHSTIIAAILALAFLTYGALCK